MSNLKPCACGKTPEILNVTEGSTFRWRYIEPDCGCGWMAEIRIDTMHKHNLNEDYKECVEAWNDLPRKGRSD